MSQSCPALKLLRRYILGACFFAAVCACRAEDQIQTYTVPKEHPPVAPAMPVTPDIPVNASPIQWTTPEGWQELPSTSIRIASFAIAGKTGQAQVAVTSFPGEVGTELDNVNRWRRELKLPPVEESAISSQPVTVDSNDGKLFDLTGATQQTVVAMVSRNGATWFFKLRGDTATVDAAKPAFAEFLQSIRFAAGGDVSPSAAVSSTPQPDPHAGLVMPAPPADTATAGGAGDSPQWNVPANWVEKEPGPMIFKRFSVPAAPNGESVITVSFFPGNVGGTLANVNRWRGQLGLPSIEEGELPTATQELNTAEGKAILVDFTGASKAGESARLVAAIVPHGENTWFYKLLGPGPAVAGEKESFVNFVKTVHYP